MVMASVNRVVLLGVISKYGVTVRSLDSGQSSASFTLVLSEGGPDGRVHTTLVECACYGRKAEAAGELDAGQLVVFEGRLQKRKKGEQWEMIVAGFEVVPVQPATTLTGSVA